MTARDQRASHVVRMTAVVFVLAMIGSACSTSGRLTEPVALDSLSEQAMSVAPAPWTDPPEGWPAMVPAPAFLEGPARVTENVLSGSRLASLETTSSVDSDALAAYVALLLDVGFSPDPRSASRGWYVRDDVEWLAFENRDLSDFLGDGSSASPRSFVVLWTTDPVRPSYCGVVESGGASCRD